MSTFTSSTSTAMYKGEWTTNVLDKWTTPHEGAYRALVVALIGDYHMRVTRSDGNEAQVLAFDHESGQTVEVDLRSATVALCEGSDVHDVHNFTSAARCVELVDIVLAGLEGPSTEVVVFGPLDLHEAAMSRQLSPGEVSTVTSTGARTRRLSRPPASCSTPTGSRPSRSWTANS